MLFCIQGTPPHMRGPHPGMRMHHQARPAGTAESTSSKSIVTLALPMYTVGIGVFFIYTCCKVRQNKIHFLQIILKVISLHFMKSYILVLVEEKWRMSN